MYYAIRKIDYEIEYYNDPFVLLSFFNSQGKEIISAWSRILGLAGVIRLQSQLELDYSVNHSRTLLLKDLSNDAVYYWAIKKILEQKKGYLYLQVFENTTGDIWIPSGDCNIEFIPMDINMCIAMYGSIIWKPFAKELEPIEQANIT